jgi:hypothetical protein
METKIKRSYYDVDKKYIWFENQTLIGGETHGMQRGWYENGNIGYINYYHIGNKYGIEKWWDIKGIFKHISTWKKSNHMGPKIFFKYDNSY